MQVEYDDEDMEEHDVRRRKQLKRSGGNASTPKRARIKRNNEEKHPRFNI
ncbi:uncharacterized protein G2W53_032555 [Senna tora]|uniref:Uncharacterized protein n=1 Tax=Senna tora TaxID=362788 RepID=A0A834WBX6_9FABA|nr:uncharacterized protein G2W53_032555 [Senna tora]